MTYIYWFDLVEHRRPRLADWRINHRGMLFLQGRLSVPAKILCLNGAAKYQSREQVYVDDVKGVELDKEYWDRYPWTDLSGAASY